LSYKIIGRIPIFLPQFSLYPFLQKEDLKPDMPSKIIQIYPSQSHHLNLVVLAAKKETPHRFKSVAARVRWYVHPRFWKQGLSAIAIYATVFSVWVYWCNR
jgi:hypothetical protein